jgi:hypothetical protein
MDAELENYVKISSLETLKRSSRTLKKIRENTSDTIVFLTCINTIKKIEEEIKNKQFK